MVEQYSSNQVKEEEDDFEMIIPEFGMCGAEADPSVVEESKVKQQLVKQTPKIEEVKKEEIVLKKPCYKCKVKEATLKNKQDVVCWECLESILVHRFKNAMTRHVGVQKDFPNLVAISGGSNSMAMLHFLYHCLSGNTSQKKMFFKVHILYIEEGPALYGWSPEETIRHRELITSTCTKYQLTYTVVPFEKVFEITRDMINVPAT